MCYTYLRTKDEMADGIFLHFINVILVDIVTVLFGSN